jgi:hypothetical protein
VPPELAIAVARHEALRPALSRALGKVTEERFEQLVAAVRAAARRAGAEALLDDLFERWVGALLDRKSYRVITSLTDESLFRRAARIVIAIASVDGILSVYRETESLAQAAAFLGELRQSAARTTPAMRAAVTALRSWGVAPEYAARYEWLKACVKAPPQG